MLWTLCVQTQAWAVFPRHTPNVAEASAAGDRLDAVISQFVQIVWGHLGAPKWVNFAYVNRGVNGVESVRPSD